MSREKDIQQRANESYESFAEDIRPLLAAVDDYDNAERYEEALQELKEGPLSFEKVITDHRHESITWEILLGTGGPAVRVLVVTDFCGVIESAEYQFQDWYQPWTAAENQDAELVQRFAEIVGFYEDQS